MTASKEVRVQVLSDLVDRAAAFAGKITECHSAEDVARIPGLGEVIKGHPGFPVMIYDALVTFLQHGEPSAEEVAQISKQRDFFVHVVTSVGLTHELNLGAAVLKVPVNVAEEMAMGKALQAKAAALTEELSRGVDDKRSTAIILEAWANPALGAMICGALWAEDVGLGREGADRKAPVFEMLMMRASFRIVSSP